MMTLLLVLMLQETDRVAAAQQGIGPFALTFMLLSMTAVTTLTVWCYYKILSGRTHFDPDGTGPARPPVPGEVDRLPRQP